MSRARAGWLRGVSGVLAAGLVVLALGLVAAEVVNGRAGTPGPGTITLVLHVAAAVVALAAQIYADRHAGPRGTAASVAVFLVTAAVLISEWLS